MIKVKAYSNGNIISQDCECSASAIKNCARELSSKFSVQAMFVSHKKGSFEISDKHYYKNIGERKTNDVGMFRTSYLLRILQETRQRALWLSADKYATAIKQIKRLSIEEIRKEGSERGFVDALFQQA